MYKFGFIGCGNMGGTLARAVSKIEKNIAVSDANAETAAAVAGQTGACILTNTEIARQCQYLVLGVKPQVVASVLAEIAPVLKERKGDCTIISMAAGKTVKDISDMAGGLPVIRIMPNTPAACGEGVILYCKADGVTEIACGDFLRCFAAAGRIIPLPEGQMDGASAISGCGPAFVYMFIEALADGGVQCGLPRALAQQLAAATAAGAAHMVLESGAHPGALKDAVCSPGGSTIEGVLALENSAFRAAAAKAVQSAYIRTKQL